MQVFSKQYTNFVNSINSEQTRRQYEYCLTQFLKHYQTDLDSFLELSQTEISDYIINYLVNRNISKKYKTYNSSKKEMKPKIEVVKIDIELLQAELNSKPEKQRNFIMRKYCGGYCNRCSDIPSKKVSYDVGDGFLVEFYCDDCFKFMKEGRSKEFIDKF